jgi:hypothetical protein
MARDGWDWNGIGPNLSKLPPHLRDNFSGDIPLRPGEVRGRVIIFKKTPGLIHPNGRILVSHYHKDAACPIGRPDGAQVDMTDFTGRAALATFLLEKQQVPAILAGLVHSFLAMGGTEKEITEVFDAAFKRSPLVQKPTIPEATDE